MEDIPLDARIRCCKFFFKQSDMPHPDCIRIVRHLHEVNEMRHGRKFTKDECAILEGLVAQTFLLNELATHAGFRMAVIESVEYALEGVKILMELNDHTT
jgi:hypothetical protein